MIKKRLLSLAVAGTMLLGMASLAMAGIPDATNSTANAGSGTVMITPTALGPSLASVGATISVHIEDAAFAPIVGYPFQDIWWDDNGNGDLAFCQGGSNADGNTDANGDATISGPAAGGGWTLAGVQVYMAGTPMAGPALTIDINSPDNTGDLVVDIADLGDFSDDLQNNPGAFRSDLIFDGILNIADVGEYALHHGTTCQ